MLSFPRVAVVVCFVVGWGTAMAAAPRVVFLGDGATYNWGMAANSNAFQANPKWINKGLPRFQTSSQLLARFHADVVSLHPVIVHIVAGAVDVDQVDDSNRAVLVQLFESNMIAMIAEAGHANIKVILGTIPPQLIANTVEQPQSWQVFEPTLTREINAWIESYGQSNKIEVVNYHDVLCACVGSTNPARSGYYPLMASDGFSPSPAGYAAITQLTETAIATLELTMTSGYLANSGNVHTVSEGGSLQFTAFGFYSDGIPRPVLNTNFAGIAGTWSSSSPSVMYVGYDGEAFAFSPGEATVAFTSLSGVRFSPWTMTVEPSF